MYLSVHKLKYTHMDMTTRGWTNSEKGSIRHKKSEVAVLRGRRCKRAWRIHGKELTILVHQRDEELSRRVHRAHTWNEKMAQKGS